MSRAVYALWFVGSALVMFDVQYVLMSKLPGIRDGMCIEGAGLTPLNIGFSIVLSILVGLMVAGLVKLMIITRRTAAAAGAGSASALGVVLGTLTVFCTACTIPVISLFGLSVSLSFFSTYDLPLKLLSIVVMGIGVFFLHRQLRGVCRR